MKKCPVCAVEVEDNAPFCNICGVNLTGAKDVGASKVETPVVEDSGKVTSTSAPPSLASSRPSFYLPALQFLLAVALLGLVLYYTTGEVPNPSLSDPLFPAATETAMPAKVASSNILENMSVPSEPLTTEESPTEA